MAWQFQVIPRPVISVAPGRDGPAKAIGGIQLIDLGRFIGPGDPNGVTDWDGRAVLHAQWQAGCGILPEQVHIGGRPAAEARCGIEQQALARLKAGIVIAVPFGGDFGSGS